MPSELAQAAKKIRADVKAAAAAKSLPPHPDGITFKVTSGTAAAMTEIRVDALNVPLAWAAPRDEDGVRHYTRDWKELEGALLEIVARHYQADGKNSFASVSIDFDTQAEEG